MKQYNPKDPLIFIHVPKTAGQTVKHIVNSWFGANFYPHYYNEAERGMPPQRDFEALAQQDEAVIYGHFNRLRGFGIQDYYPQARQFVTILRDPLQMALSHYFYVRKSALSWKDKTRLPQQEVSAHIATTKLNMLNHFPVEVTADNYQDVVQAYFIYIGITERLPESLSNIAQLLNKPAPLEVPTINATERSDVSLSQDVVDAFKRNNSLEYTVYNYVKNMNFANV